MRPAAVGCCVIALSLFTPAAAAGPPNVVLIVGGGQAWKDYGFTGGPPARTPNLDKLAAEGLVFPRGYTATSSCRAGLATVATGLYPHRHKLTSDDPPLPEGRTAAEAEGDERFHKHRAEAAAEFEKVPTLPKLLAAAGYVCHQSGKSWDASGCRGEAADPGQDGRPGLKAATDFIDAAKKNGKPFFAWYAPDTPAEPPERLLAKYKDSALSAGAAKRLAAAEWFDEAVGELLAHLDEQGLRDDTLVLFVNAYGPPADRTARTPVVVRWPGKIARGRSDVLAGSTDIAPTVLAAAGLMPPADMTGLDLRDAAALKARDAVYGEEFTRNAKDVHDPAANLTARWVVRWGWKLVVPSPANAPGGAIELFDVTADPDETKNLAATSPNRVAELAKLLDAWWPVK